MKKQRKFEAKEEFFLRNGGLLLEKQISSCADKAIALRIFTAKELNKATNNYDTSLFHSQIQSTVYRGNIDGRVVAVKTPERLQVSDYMIEFYLNQAVTQSQIYHKHVVKLFGCCLETDIPILVQEFVPNGSLADHITGTNSVLFPWSSRLRVASEIADAVTYLHCVNSNPVIHRDIRSNNILFDENHAAKLSNFGLSVVIPFGKTGTEFGVEGTDGYIDPEYVETARLSGKCDVYSFGVVLLELLCWETVESEPCFVDYFIYCMKRGCLDQIVGKCTEGEQEKAQSLAYATLAMKCIQVAGEERPTIMEAAKELRRIKTFIVASN